MQADCAAMCDTEIRCNLLCAGHRQQNMWNMYPGLSGWGISFTEQIHTCTRVPEVGPGLTPTQPTPASPDLRLLVIGNLQSIPKVGQGILLETSGRRSTSRSAAASDIKG